MKHTFLIIPAMIGGMKKNDEPPRRRRNKPRTIRVIIPHLRQHRARGFIADLLEAGVF